jgi:hypothetical protein
MALTVTVTVGFGGRFGFGLKLAVEVGERREDPVVSKGDIRGGRPHAARAGVAHCGPRQRITVAYGHLDQLLRCKVARACTKGNGRYVIG